jgi:subtilisin family serine protease
MTKRWTALLTFALLLGAQVRAQDVVATAPLDADAVANTSIVWVKPGNTLASIRSRLADKHVAVTNELEASSSMMVEGNAVDVQRTINEDPGLAAAVDYVEPNGIVRLFPSECVKMEIPRGELLPYGVKRVHGPIAMDAPGKRVWIIDSGISRDYDNRELVVDRTLSAECNANGCQGGDADDGFGHGTAVASIVAAIDNEQGLVGVAPGVTLVPIKVFESPEADWASIYSATNHLISHVAPGDVVNISFGGMWEPLVNAKPRGIERQLRMLADRGVRVAVAAGNLDALPHSAYVQTVSPARAGAYRVRESSGAVLTVSAIDENDFFWPESGFGNGEAAPDSAGVHLGPPDVAEPGVKVPALWIGGQMRTCTGTSFAAPHLAGILLQGLPEHDGQVKGDIDTRFVGLSGIQTDAARGDPIGVCAQEADGKCHVR